MDATFFGYRQFDASIPPKQPGDFSWIGFKKGDTRPGSISHTEFTSQIASLQASVRSIDLSGNGLGLSEVELLPTLMDTLKDKPAIREIDLNFNALGRMVPLALADALRRIPPSVCMVHLNNNRLGELLFDDFKQVMHAVSMEGRTVSVVHNSLEKFPTIELTCFLATLDSTIQNDEVAVLPSPW